MHTIQNDSNCTKTCHFACGILHKQTHACAAWTVITGLAINVRNVSADYGIIECSATSKEVWKQEETEREKQVEFGSHYRRHFKILKINKFAEPGYKLQRSCRPKRSVCSVLSCGLNVRDKNRRMVIRVHIHTTLEYIFTPCPFTYLSRACGLNCSS